MEEALSRVRGQSGRIGVCYVDCVGSCSEMTVEELNQQFFEELLQSSGWGN